MTEGATMPGDPPAETVTIDAHAWIEAPTNAGDRPPMGSITIERRASAAIDSGIAGAIAKSSLIPIAIFAFLG
ncbi:MAG: hypothetical protein KDC98_24045 [Planctomycetes bacterium]|nr:hypothetical protein [Planctomycetota bacterium]